jgi:hypothetical protein
VNVTPGFRQVLDHGVATSAVTQAQAINGKQAFQIHWHRKHAMLDNFNDKLAPITGMIVCADDYGLREDINRSILELCNVGKLSAVSCMVLLERCTAASLEELRRHESSIDMGLHLCLTDEGLPLSGSVQGLADSSRLPRFGLLLRRALSRRINPQQLRLDISKQYELFVEKCGRRPDYIDGHLHVHQLPVIGEALVAFVQSLPVGSRPYVRNTCLPLRELRRRGLPWLKSAMIGFFGKRMLSLLNAAAITTNQGFAGIYDFRCWSQYEAYFPKFVECLPNTNGLLVVHPGADEDWRRKECEVLRRFDFPAGSPNRFRR